MKQQIVEIIVSQIIDGLKKGNIPWKQTWISRGQKNMVTKKVYKGFNQILLSSIASDRKWSNYWVSYKQAKELGGNVKTSENKNGIRIAYYKTLDNLVEENGKMIKKTIPILRYFTIFNISQCEGIEIPQEEENKIDMNLYLIEDIDKYRFLEEIGLIEGSPAYIPSIDKIRMPDKRDFDGINEYYHTYFHEICHSTGAEKRLDRKLQVKDMEEYSKEELVAEIGASILMNENGLERDKTNTQAYINGWIKLLTDKPQIIISAGNKAFRAVAYYLEKIGKNDLNLLSS